MLGKPSNPGLACALPAQSRRRRLAINPIDPAHPMKLATYKDGSRDGQLVVVSRDLSSAHYATGTATRLQQVLDDWNFLSPQLQDLYVTLNQGKARHAFAFEPRQCMAPLPRAYQWAEASAYLNPVALVHRADGPTFEPVRDAPWVCQGGSDDFLGPCGDAWFGSETWGIDFSAGLAVITGDVGMGASPEQALDGVRLLMLANAWTLCQLATDERAQGRGRLHSKPAAAFSPVAVTPDELGEGWRRGQVHGMLRTHWNGQQVGLMEAGIGMKFHFGQLIAHLAKTRNLRAGTIVGSGPVTNLDPTKGYASIEEKRGLEALHPGGVTTGWMQFGDSVRIEMTGRDGLSLFGAIDQRVSGPGCPAEPGAGNAQARAQASAGDADVA